MFDWLMELEQTFCIMIMLLEFDRQVVKQLIFY